MENWREIIEITAQGQKAMTKLEDIKSIVNYYGLEDDTKVKAIKQILEDEKK